MKQNKPEENIKNFFKDKLTLEELLRKNGKLEEYQNGDLEDKVCIVNSVTLSLLEGDPEAEVWAPIRYWKCAKFAKNKTRLYFESDIHFISNKGNFYCGTLTEQSVLKTHDTNYYKNGIRIGGKLEYVSINRAVACVFVPETKGRKLVDLVVNHMDLVTTNNDFRNLEWCTDEENIQHALDNGVVNEYLGKGIEHPHAIPLLGIFPVDSPWPGLRFHVTGNSTLKKYRLAAPNYLLKIKSWNRISYIALPKNKEKDFKNIEELSDEQKDWIKYPKTAVYTGVSITDPDDIVEVRNPTNNKNDPFTKTGICGSVNKRQAHHRGYVWSRKYILEK